MQKDRPEDFDTIFLTYYPRLVGYAESILGDSDAAADVVQDVMVRVWKSGDLGSHKSSLTPYLYRAARNAALNHIRSSARSLVRDEAWTVEQSTEMSESAASELRGDPDWATRADLVEKLVQSLPPRCREVFTLRWKHSMPYAEIAEVMGISVKTVEMQMTIAVKALRKAVSL